jgi:hypothetical protein
MSRGGVFVYGSLLAGAPGRLRCRQRRADRFRRSAEEVLTALLGRVPRRCAATLPGYARYALRGRVYPGILPQEGAAIDGKARAACLCAAALQRKQRRRRRRV